MSTVARFDSSKILKNEEYSSYQKDIWNKDYGSGLYFSAFEELGEPLYVPFQINSEWIYLPHGIYDGFSALKELDLVFNLKLKLGPHDVKIPKGFYGWIQGLLSALNSSPLEHHQFTKPNGSIPKGHLSYIKIELPFTDCKVQVMSNILNALSIVCMEKLSENSVTRWMIPVNISHPLTKSKKGHLNASYIGVNCSKNDSKETTRTKIVGKLKASEHWGFWLISKIGLFFGKKIILKATEKDLSKAKSTWFGSFSNLGDIGGDMISDLTILHPVREQRPIGAILYLHNGKFQLTLSFHESLGVGEELLKEIKDAVYKRAVQ